MIAIISPITKNSSPRNVRILDLNDFRGGAGASFVVSGFDSVDSAVMSSGGIVLDKVRFSPCTASFFHRECSAPFQLA